MRNRARFGVAFVGALALAACGEPMGPSPYGSWQAVQVDDRVVHAYTSFGLDLFRELRAEEPGDNVFVSPTSAAFALAMTYNGAAGRTFEEMAEVLGVAGLPLEVVNEANRTWLGALRDTQDPRVSLAVANSIWARQDFPFHEAFYERNRRYYDAEVATLDFDDPASVDVINDWVEEATRGRIKDLVEDIGGDEVMYLINALHFDGEWTHRFDESATRDWDFTRPDGSRVTVPMMMRTGLTEAYFGADAQVARLPYGNGRFGMVVALPAHGSTLDELVAGLTPGRWDEWMAGLAEQEVAVGLPRLELEWESSFVEALRRMGMQVPFGAGADFSGLSPVPGLFISEVFQKTYLRVDEEGTEAAAATKVIIGRVSGPPSIILDRPFLLAIHDAATETILFIGQIVDPS
jgi:serine protease inhibitor